MQNDTPIKSLTGEIMPRLSSLQCMSPTSPCLGSLDRTFWHYRTIKGFPSATYQQPALAFSIWASLTYEEGKDSVASEYLLRAGIAADYWGACQNRDGSFDEWYRNEKSYCATSFTTFAMIESLLRQPELATNARISRIAKATKWISRHKNPSVMNQNLAACCALWSASRLLGDNRLENDAILKWQLLEGNFMNSSWYKEYGGWDTGYSTLALDLLACLHQRGFAAAQERGIQLANWIENVTPRSGVPCPFIGSRETFHVFPFGINYFSYLSGNQQKRKSLATAFAKGLIPTPATVDDRYLCYFYAPHFALAAEYESQAKNHEQRIEKLPLQMDEETRSSQGKMRKETELIIYDAGDFDIAISPEKCGACVIHTEDRIFQLASPILTDSRGVSWSTTPRTHNHSYTHSKDLELTFSGTVYALNSSYPLSKWDFLFNLFTHTALRSSTLSKLFHAWVKSRNIEEAKSGPLNIERTVRATNSGHVTLEEVIRKAQPTDGHFKISFSSSTQVHSPSSSISARSAPTQLGDSLRDRDALNLAQEAGKTLLHKGSVRLVTTLTKADSTISVTRSIG